MNIRLLFLLNIILLIISQTFIPSFVKPPSEVDRAMVGNIGLGTLAGVIHPYPTQAEAIRQLGDLYNRTKLTPGVKGMLTKFLAWPR